MARPNREEIETYMTITGASETLALQKLQEHDGNLYEAVNAFYGEEDAHSTTNYPPPPTGYPEPERNVVHSGRSGRGLFPILSAARSFKPSLLLDPNYRRDIYNRLASASSSLLSPQGPASSAPAEPNYRLEQMSHYGPRPTVGNDHIPMGYNTSDVENHVEDEILQAVIRDSLRNSEASSNSGHSERQLHQEEDDLARAVSLSLETAEKEDAIREQQMRACHQGLGVDGRSKWGSISSEELDESIMLENAHFGSTSGGTLNNFLSSSQLKSGSENSTVSDLQPIHRSLSPLHEASRLVKEQQDKEYQASLLLDKQKQEESHGKMLNEVERERALAAKRASLSREPASDDENAVTLLVRMPNGSRSSRRFLKSDKLQLLFNFIDIGGEVKPGTYRVVRPYPRQAFNLTESSSTLSELGLTNKQEVLFLEFI